MPWQKILRKCLDKYRFCWSLLNDHWKAIKWLPHYHLMITCIRARRLSARCFLKPSENHVKCTFSFSTKSKLSITNHLANYMHLTYRSNIFWIWVNIPIFLYFNILFAYCLFHSNLFFFSHFFIYLVAPQPILGYCWGGSLINLMLITAFTYLNRRSQGAF